MGTGGDRSGYIPHLDRTIGQDNKKLLQIAREVIVKSPPINDVIAMSDEYKATKEKEIVGLGFNRYVMDALSSRWNKLELAQINLKHAMLLMKGPLDDLSMRGKQLAKDTAKDRVQVLVLGSRIRQFEGLAFNLESYCVTLRNLIEYYRPYKNFMRQCAEKMQFQNEMVILYRYETLSIVKQEMVEGSIASFNEMEEQKQKLAQLKEECEKINLRLSNEICTLIQTHYDKAKANVNFETKLNTAMAESSETARSLFRIVSGIRKLYDSFDRYKQIDKKVFDPFEMVDVIHWRFLNIQSAIDDIYRLTEAENLQGVIPESNAHTNYRNIDPKDNLLNLKEAENKSNQRHDMAMKMKGKKSHGKKNKFPSPKSRFLSPKSKSKADVSLNVSSVAVSKKSSSRLQVRPSLSKGGKLAPIRK